MDVVFLLLAVLSSPAPPPLQAPSCKPDGNVMRVSQLPEGSGAAAAGSTRIWSHNDSGLPELVRVDAQSGDSRRVKVHGADVEDWEAIAAGPCATGTCLYIGDIGDNDARRRDVTIYVVPMPTDSDTDVRVAQRIRARYPDGPHDAEALLVAANGDILIVTKGDTGPVAMYRVPRTGGTVEMERIAAPERQGQVGADDRITDGAISPDGGWIVFRTKTDLRFHRAADVRSGKWREVGRSDVSALGEPQGEGVTFAGPRVLYLVGEGGGQSRPGTLVRMNCTF